MTVAAQQRAEAAYRRQRMAQERAEQTAVWRAEMEVERARLLKEMSGGGSRRPSYCKELEDLKGEAPEGALLLTSLKTWGRLFCLTFTSVYKWVIFSR